MEAKGIVLFQFTPRGFDLKTATNLRILLTLLATGAFAYQFYSAWALLNEVVWNPQRVQRPWHMQTGTSAVRETGPAADAAGLRAGDQILALAGEPYDGLNDFERALNSRRPGDSLKVRWRSAERVREGVLRLDAVSQSQTWVGSVVAVVVNLLTPAACLIVGFGVALIRPLDRKAWIVWLMMVSFANVVIFDVISSRVPDWLNGVATVYRPVAASMWGLSMVLFAIYFPARFVGDRKAPWLKYVLIAPLVLNAVGTAALTYREFEDYSAFGWVAAVYGEARWVPFWLNAIAIGVFFAVLGWRGGTEQQPDAKRRLRIIRWGMSIGLTPIFFVMIAGQMLGRDSFSTFPPWIVLPSLLLLVFYPLTMFYVIVVERALDLQVVVRQGLQYALAQRSVIVLQVLLAAFAMTMAASVISDADARRPERLQALALAALFLVAGRRIFAKAQSWIDKRFFREAVSAERVLTELGDSVRTIHETPSLVKRVAEVVRDTLHVDQVAVLLAGHGGMTPAYETGTRMVEELRLPLRSRDRVVGELVLGQKKSEEPYSKSDVRLLETVADQAGIAIENNEMAQTIAKEAGQRERIQRELEIAKEIQERLFPQKLPTVAGVEYSGYCRPAMSIGGDYYDFYSLPGDGLAIAIGDVSGKGVGSALLMASLQGSLRSLTAQGTNDLSVTLERVNQLIHDVSPGSKYATFFYAQYDSASRNLSYVNCGHCEPFVIRGSEVLPLSDGGPVIGLFPQAKYQQSEIALMPGDLLVGYTDGFSEAMNASEEEWGEGSVIAIARKHREQNPNQIIASLIADADAFTAGAPQSDDMTVIVLRVI